MTPYRALLIIVAAAVVLLAGIFGSGFLSAGDAYTSESIVRGVQGFDDLALRFEELAREEGGVKAFEVLRETRLPPNIDLHLLGHKIGDVLYDQEGIDGIALCTDEFRNACSHTMVVGALTDFGESALPTIREACKRAPGGPGAYTMCYHGLGHGVTAFYGYSIPETVELCEKTGTEEYRNREAIECVGGAVMELTGGGGHDREAWLIARAEYIETDPVGFCIGDLMPEFAKEQCLTYITPELWEKVGIDMGSPDPLQYADAFKLCDRIPLALADLRESCFGGFGKEFVPLAAGRDIRTVDSLPDERYAQVIQWCGYAGVPEGVRSCIEHALHSIFWGGENDPAASLRFCGLIDDEDAARRCFVTLAMNIQNYLRGPEVSRWCSQLPQYARESCSRS